MNEEQIKAICDAMSFLAVMEDYYGVYEDLSWFLNVADEKAFALRNANVPRDIIVEFEQSVRTFEDDKRWHQNLEEMMQH